MVFKTTIGNKGGLVDRYINTSYDIVKLVANNIDAVLSVGTYVDGGQIDDAIAAAVTTAADVIITNADVVITNADVVSTNADAVATAADLLNVQSLYDQFDDRYLGSNAVNPTLDNDGDALLEGALYWNSVSKELRIWSGTGWVVSASAAFTAFSDNTTGVFATINDHSIAFGSGSTSMQTNWSANGDTILLGDRTSIYDWVSTYLGNNAVWAGAGWEYAVDGFASQISLISSGRIEFSVGNTGIGGDTLTLEKVMAVENNGEVSLDHSTAALTIAERITGPALLAGYGKIWVRSVDDTLRFTNQVGTEFELSTGNATTSKYGNVITMLDSEYQEGSSADAHKAITLGNLINNGAVSYSKYCTADVTVNNTTAMQNVTGMAIDYEAGAHYAVEACLILDQATAAAGLRIYFLTGATTTNNGVWELSSVTVSSKDMQSNSSDVALLDSDGSSFQVVTFKGKLYAGGPDETGQIRIGQQTAVVGDTVIKIGSWIRLTQLSTPI